MIKLMDVQLLLTIVHSMISFYWWVVSGEPCFSAYVIISRVYFIIYYNFHYVLGPYRPRWWKRSLDCSIGKFVKRIRHSWSLERPQCPQEMIEKNVNWMGYFKRNIAVIYLKCIRNFKFDWCETIHHSSYLPDLLILMTGFWYAGTFIKWFTV